MPFGQYPRLLSNRTKQSVDSRRLSWTYCTIDRQQEYGPHVKVLVGKYVWCNSRKKKKAHDVLTAARAMLDEEHEQYKSQVPHDNNSYVLGRIHGYNVLIACLPAGLYSMVYNAYNDSL